MVTQLSSWIDRTGATDSEIRAQLSDYDNAGLGEITYTRDGGFGGYTFGKGSPAGPIIGNTTVRRVGPNGVYAFQRLAQRLLLCLSCHY